MRDATTHTLSFSVRYNHHFMGSAVTDTLPIRLASSLIRPVVSSAGSIRHSDGTYRFIDVQSGIHRVLWLPSFETSYRNWVSWDPPLEITLPMSNPAVTIERDLWPAPSSLVPGGITAIRGKVIGAPINDQLVRIQPTAGPANSFVTRTESQGEFLFLLPMRIVPNGNGRVELTIEVAGRVITGGEFSPETTGDPFAGSQFKVRPSRETRIKFHLA